MRSSRWMRRLGLAAVASAVAWFSVGCAQERAPINRVQANALDKSFFVGANLSDPSDDPEFYMRNTVIDVPYGAMQDGLFTASYAQPLSRIKWEISEQTLIARQTYEHIQDSDFNGSKRTTNGQVVAMFNITSHFDIKRAYNAQTGEENNVVEENSTDRPWYQRQFFRVDWSKNLVTDGYEVDTLSQIGLFGGVKFDPISYYVEDPASPDAPVFAAEEGYFDVTTKAFATPQIVDTPYGNFPACFFFGKAPVANCNPTEVTLRLSFRKVVDTDYEIVDQTGQKQDAFGWFTVDRYGYERNYGVLDEKWHRFAARYNIWQQSHVAGSQCAVDYWRDENGNVARYKVDGNHAFILDGVTGLPIPDPNGDPYPGTPVGADVHRDGKPTGKTDAQGHALYANVNHTEDDCEFYDANGALVNPGSRCDEFAHKCTLPLYARKIRTIPWYYGKDAAPDLFASTAVALGQWNLAVKRAAQIGKAVEAKRVAGQNGTVVNVTFDEKGNASTTTGEMPDANSFITSEDDLTADAGATVPDVFVLCHNPVVQGDNAACGKPGTVARLGDIRYNIVNIITNPQTPSPWGIMVDADDPLTGEKVATSVNEWGHVLDIAAQGTEDLLRWINGEIGDNQIASGAYLRDWVNASKLGTAPHQAPTLDAKEVQSRMASLDTSLSKAVQLTPAQQKLPAPLQRLAKAQLLAQKWGPSMDTQLEATRQQLVGTKWESMLVTPDWLQAAGLDPKTPTAGNDSAIAAASMLRGQNPMLQRWVKRMRDVTLASRASCQLEQPEPDSLVGMARQAMRLFPLPNLKDPSYPAKKAARDQALHQWIREQFHISVIAHEMGHSMGLRHNFTGTFDPLNFHTQYWQLRTQNGKEHYCVAGQDTDGKTIAVAAKSPTDGLLAMPDKPLTDGHTCVGPRWYDPVTDDEVNGLVWKWGSSTVMDYPGDQTQDMNDIGPYDKAAMRFGYADVVDVDTDAVLRGQPDVNGGDKASAFLQALDGFGGIGGRTIGGNHYSTYADKYGVLGKCTGGDGKDPLTAKCSGPPLDYVSIHDMRSQYQYDATIAQMLPQTVANFAIDPKGRIRHPYMFGSDEFADFGNVPVFRFDSGADSYEQMEFIISTYENRYIFDNFRRDRVMFTTEGTLQRDRDRYFDKIQGITKSLAFLVELSSNADTQKTDPGQLMPMVLGASDGLRMFARIVTRPEPGPYNIQYPAGVVNDKPMPYATNLGFNTPTPGKGDFYIGLGSGEGRYLHNDYDYSQGYYWADYQTQVGSYYEKSLAVWYLTEAYNHFISNQKEDYIDGRYKNLNYASLYPNQIRRLLTQLLQNDPMTLGAYVTTEPGTGEEKDGTAHVKYLPWEKWDQSDASTTTLDYPKGGIVLDPLVGWEQQYHMLVDLFYMGPTTLTMDLVDQLRIYSPGGGDTISLDPSEQVRYRDPMTGILYVARNYGTEALNTKAGYQSAKAMGARMIQYANQLAATAYVVDAIDSATGELTYHKDANGQPVCKYQHTNDEGVCYSTATTLKAYSANLDVVRQLTLFFGYGPLGHGEH